LVVDSCFPSMSGAMHSIVREEDNRRSFRKTASRIENRKLSNRRRLKPRAKVEYAGRRGGRPMTLLKSDYVGGVCQEIREKKGS